MGRISGHSTRPAPRATLKHYLRCLIRHGADKLRRSILSHNLLDVKEIGKRGDNYLIGIIIGSYLPNDVDLS